jgi:hypothetical protein
LLICNIRCDGEVDWADGALIAEMRSHGS